VLIFTHSVIKIYRLQP